MVLLQAPAFLATGVSIIVAASALLRRPRGAAEWSFAVGMLLLGAESACTGLTLRATTDEEIVRWQTWSHTIKAFLPAVWILFSGTFARANAPAILKQRRHFLAAAFLVAGIVVVALRPRLVLEVDADQTRAFLGWPGVVVHATLLMGFIFSLMELERTYRASVGMARWRIKSMLLGLGVLFVVRVYTSSQALLYNALDLSIIGIGPGALLIADVLIVRSLLRPGQFIADLYPSRSLLQGSITIVLAGAYLIVVGVLAKLAGMLGGASSFPFQAFVVLLSLVGLAMVAQSDHARLRLRRFVSRHFQRPRVDYRTTWLQFATHATEASDAPTLCRNVVRIFAEAFEVLSVTVWLVNDRRDGFLCTASSSQVDGASADLPLDAGTVTAAIAHFRRHPEPLDLETVSGDWVCALRRMHPNAFPRGGHRICIPLVGRGELLGLITLGDRIGPEAFSAADLDLFKCAGDHVAAGLLNAQLSQRLLQLKEVESFQLMAAFFVHDLKNAASTLNLLLTNLPEHFHDPEFRADALRVCAKSARHINDLIGRLTELRQELRVQPAAVDLNLLVEHALDDLPRPGEVTVQREFQPVPPVALDASQFMKVVLNLLLNARDAITGKGTITVQTGPTAEGGFVAVTDTGCGMSADFLRRSLFRPFQTTKQRGLGIGMFQSKMIVEAHGGRIDVKSTPGQGTTFRVTVPGLAGRA